MQRKWDEQIRVCDHVSLKGYHLTKLPIIHILGVFIFYFDKCNKTELRKYYVELAEVSGVARGIRKKSISKKIIYFLANATLVYIHLGYLQKFQPFGSIVWPASVRKRG